jgi:hypothetical protein
MTLCHIFVIVTTKASNQKIFCRQVFSNSKFCVVADAQSFLPKHVKLRQKHVKCDFSFNLTILKVIFSNMASRSSISIAAALIAVLVSKGKWSSARRNRLHAVVNRQRDTGSTLP